MGDPPGMGGLGWRWMGDTSSRFFALASSNFANFRSSFVTH